MVRVMGVLDSLLYIDNWMGKLAVRAGVEAWERAADRSWFPAYNLVA